MDRKVAISTLLTLAVAGLAQPALAADKPIIGIVAISGAEANNQRFIKGASDEAAKIGYDVSVIDAAGSADQANAAFQNLAQRKVAAILSIAFPVSSLGAGIAAAQAANIPVGTWGGGLGPGVAASDGDGGPMAVPIVEMMAKDMGGKGSVLELNYHPGQVCIDREKVADDILAKTPDIKISKNEVRIPGVFEDAAQYATAWLASHPEGSEPLAIWGCWDDPAVGAISALRQQNRTDVKVYAENGNPQALEAVQKGFMTATAWEYTQTEGSALVDLIDQAIKAGASWQPKKIDVPAIIVTKDTYDDFLKQHPEAFGK